MSSYCKWYFDSPKYYLRLLENADQFLDKYADNLSRDIVIKAETKDFGMK